MVFRKLPEGSSPALTLYCDGGTIGGSPGRGIYYSVGTADEARLRAHDESGRLRRSDDAEYLAMIAALDLVGRDCVRGDTVLVRMDCKPAIDHIVRGVPPKNGRLRKWYDLIMTRIRELTDAGINLVFEWISNQEIKLVLGH